MTRYITNQKQPFWKIKSFQDMSKEEWESLCDGCGRCCLVKYTEEDSSNVYYTNVACKLLDCDSCRCKSYQNRTDIVPDCVIITPENIGESDWLPSSCAYRKLFHNQELSDWHPLISGNSESVHEAGLSVRYRAVSETELDCEEYDEYIIDWEIGDVSQSG